jgi:hypothetical protein
MTHSGRLLCALYLATSGGLLWTAVLEFLYGPRWAGFLFAAASLVPVIAVVRETLIGDLRGAVVRRSAAARPVADDIVRSELEAACCERWWTSLGLHHDSTCPHGTRRSSAA